MGRQTLDIILAGILLIAAQRTEQVSCQLYINEKRQLVEVWYTLRPSKENPKRPYLIPIKENILKENAGGEDIRNYKCGENKQ